MKNQHSYLHGDDMTERELRESEDALANEHPGIDAENDELFEEFRTNHGASSFLLQTGRDVKGQLVGSATPQVVRTSNRALQFGLPALALLTLVSALVLWPEPQSEQAGPEQHNAQVELQSEISESNVSDHQSTVVAEEVLEPEANDDNATAATTVEHYTDAETVSATMVEPATSNEILSQDVEAQPEPPVQVVHSLEETSTTAPQRVGIQIVNPSLASEEQTLRESITATQSREEKMDLHLQLARLHLDRRNFDAAADSYLETVALANELKATEFKRNALEECVVLWEQAGTRAASIALAREAVKMQDVSALARTKAQETIDSSTK